MGRKEVRRDVINYRAMEQPASLQDPISLAAARRRRRRGGRGRGRGRGRQVTARNQLSKTYKKPTERLVVQNRTSSYNGNIHIQQRW